MSTNWRKELVDAEVAKDAKREAIAEVKRCRAEVARLIQFNQESVEQKRYLHNSFYEQIERAQQNAARAESRLVDIVLQESEA